MSCTATYVDINSMQDYLKCIIDYDLLHPHWLLRGQHELSNPALLPRIARDGRSSIISGTRMNERLGFEMFKRSLPLHGLYLQQLKEIDVLAIAQHYKLKTRMLDWSSSPLIALYFACEKVSGNDPSIVYACKFTKDSYKGYFVPNWNENLDPFDVQEIVVYAPDFIDNRIYNQRGVFTIHPYHQASDMFEGINELTANLEQMVIFKINDKVEVKIKLEKLGFSPLTVYNTLEATAEYANNWKLF